MAQDFTNLQQMAQQYGHQTPNQSNPKRPQSGLGCVFVIIVALFFAGMGALVYFWVYPTYFSDSENSNDSGDKKEKSVSGNKSSKKSSLKGMLMNSLIITGENDSKNLWITTYRYKDNTYYTYTYIYNPVDKKVLKNFEKEYKAYPPQTRMYFVNNEVWKLSMETSDIEASVNVYDPVSGEEKLNTKSFAEKFPELQGGISKVSAYSDIPKFDIETRDGKKPVFDIEKNKLFDNYSEYRNSYKDDKKEMTIFALGNEKSGETARKNLFLVTGPQSSLWEKNVSEHYLNDASTLKFFTKSVAKPLIADKIFLEGALLYQDDECCIVLHQNQVGSNAERLLSCIDRSGNIMWTASTEKDLFPKLRASSKDPSTGMSSLKYASHVMRSDDLVLFSCDRYGFIGFDYKTGEKLFESVLSE